MKAGILKSWYFSKIKQAQTPREYFLAINNYILYCVNTFNFNVKNIR